MTDPDATPPRQSVILLLVLLGICLETGVFFLALLFSGAYLLATLASLVVMVVLVVGFVLLQRRRARPTRSR